MSKLNLEIASFCDAGIKAINEDAAGYFQPEDPYFLESKGVSLVVSDGVSTAEEGKEASETVVNGFIEEYYRTPDTWSVGHSGESILSTLNLKLFRKSHEFSDNKGFLCTFSALVIKGQTAHFFHVGDSRVYLLRQDKLSQLTSDHTAKISDNDAVLARAIGMDNRLHLDYGKVVLQPDDIVLLCSDGLHDFVPEAKLIESLASNKPLANIVSTLKQLALEHQSNDNISAVVGKVNTLFEQSLDDYSVELTRLPFPPVLQKGLKLDGYEVVKELFASSRSQLYLVIDSDSGARYAMKTPSINFEDDMGYIDRFVQEEWIGLRVQSPNVVRVVRQERARTALYYLMEYIEGVNLAEWMQGNRQSAPKQCIALVKQIAQGLEAFHQYETVHQDIKPGNIIVTADERAVIVDFGSVYVAGLAEIERAIQEDNTLGTAGYADPTYLSGRNPGFAGDVYSLATITYEMFTGHLPYGDDISECRLPRDFDRLRYHKAADLNPLIPVWFDRTLEKGTSFSLEQRYPGIAPFMKDLTRPNPEFLSDEAPTPQVANSQLFWKLMSGFWFITLLLVIYLFETTV